MFYCDLKYQKQQANAYDSRNLDATWGLAWDRRIYTSDDDTMSVAGFASLNCLWEKLYANYYDEIVARYAELRQSILTMANIESAFSAFFDSIPDVVRAAEAYKWPDVPSQDTNDLQQILTFAAARAAYLDECLGI